MLILFIHTGVLQQGDVLTGSDAPPGDRFELRRQTEGEGSVWATLKKRKEKNGVRKDVALANGKQGGL